MFMKGSSLLPFNPTDGLGMSPSKDMTSSLRKRLGRRAALQGLKTGSASEGNSASSSQTSLKESSSAHPDQDPEQKIPTIAKDDLSTTPPPDRKLPSSKGFSHDKTPPKLLLERYKQKAAKHAVPAATATVKSGISKTTPTGTWKSLGATADGLGGKQKRKDSLPSPVDSAYTPDFESLNNDKDTQSTQPKKTGETKTVRGTEFDMVKSSSSKPKEEVTRQGPTAQDKDGERHHRRTRSQSKREVPELKREVSMEDELSADMKELHLDNSLHLPAPLSIKKVDRTPSPRYEDNSNNSNPERESPKRDGLWKSARSFEKKQSSPPQLLPHPLNSSPPTPAKSELRQIRDPAVVDQAVSNMMPFKPHPVERAVSPQQSDSDNSIRTPPKVKKSILKNATNTSPDAKALALTINPPVAMPHTPAGYIFCSGMLGTSRPVEPWAWCKRWTCCACGPEDELGYGGAEDRGMKGAKGGMHLVGAVVTGNDDVERNGRGEAKPALTMAEQKICSRLACGHVRCAGCWVEREGRFEGRGPFGL